MPHTPGGCICVNGRLFEPEQATVSVLDAGFLLGDGLFESLRATVGVPHLLDRHLQRLFTAAAELEFANMPSVKEVEEQVLHTIDRAALIEAYVRVTITRGTGGVGLAPPPGLPTVVVAVLPARPLTRAEDGIEAALLWGQRDRRVSAKSTSWQPAVLARRRVEDARADEGIYVAASGNVLEGVASNVFAVEGERLLTPCVSECLPGVTRGRVLELARDQGVDVLEAPLPVDALMEADGVFVTNAVQGLRAVRTVSGAAIGGRGLGGLFDSLHRLYEQDRMGVLEVSG
jgi:branched-subunit amino acid aminotransferase/4-amino-4-deoxychorismate lyase